MKNPKVSVVIIAKNEEEFIGDCLESIKKQTFRDFEIIVVDDGSSDNTVKIGSEYTKRVFQTSWKGRPFARNRGIKEAKGEIIAFIDADAVAHENWLENLVKILSLKEIFAATGKTNHKAKESNLLARLIELDYSYRKELRNPEVEMLDTANCAIKRELFDQVGFFDKDFSRIEDTRMTEQILKSNYKIFYEPSAEVTHFDVSNSSFAFVKKEFEHGRQFSSLFVRSKNIRGYEHVRPWLYIQPIMFYSLFLPIYPYNIFILLFFTLALNSGLLFYTLKERARYLIPIYVMSFFRNLLWFFGSLGFLLNSLKDRIIKKHSG